MEIYSVSLKILAKIIHKIGFVKIMLVKYMYYTYPQHHNTVYTTN